MQKNPYTVLGLSPGVSDEVLRRRYRQRLMTVHPDRNPKDPRAQAKTEAVIEAYQYLSDPVRRRVLDDTLADAGQAKRSKESSANTNTSERKKPKKRKRRKPAGSSDASTQHLGRNSVSSTVSINGKVVQLNSSGSINVVVGNSRVQIQQRVFQTSGSSSKRSFVSTHGSTDLEDVSSAKIKAMIEKIMGGGF